jgi:hypothetical protein
MNKLNADLAAAGQGLLSALSDYRTAVLRYEDYYDRAYNACYFLSINGITVAAPPIIDWPELTFRGLTSPAPNPWAG